MANDKELDNKESTKDIIDDGPLQKIMNNIHDINNELISDKDKMTKLRDHEENCLGRLKDVLHELDAIRNTIQKVIVQVHTKKK